MEPKDVAADPSAWYLGVGGVTLGGLFLLAVANALREHIFALVKRILFGNSEEIAAMKAKIADLEKEAKDRKEDLEEERESRRQLIREEAEARKQAFQELKEKQEKLEERVIETEKHGGRIEAILEANHTEAIRAITDLSGNIAALVSRVDQLHLAAAANAAATAHTALHASQQGA